MAKGVGFTLGELALALHATLEGDPSRIVTGVAPLEAAGPGEISFLVDRRYTEAARTSRAGAVLVPADGPSLSTAVLRVAAPQQGLVALLSLFNPPSVPPAGRDPSAIVAADARVHGTASIGPLAVVESCAVVGPGVWVHAFVFIGAGVEIGEGSILHPRVVLYPGVRLGCRVVVHAGAVIGADGFGYAPDGGVHRKIPQVGSVRIEDDVEIGANTTIDRAMLGETIVRQGTKIDNLVQIGHNVEIGAHSILVAQVGVSGSSRIGRGVILAGQVGVADHVTIGDGVVAGAQAGIPSDITAGEKVFGSPARPAGQARRIWAAEVRLPELVRRVRAAERRLQRLEGQLGIAGPSSPLDGDDE